MSSQEELWHLQLQICPVLVRTDQNEELSKPSEATHISDCLYLKSISGQPKSIWALRYSISKLCLLATCVRVWCPAGCRFSMHQFIHQGFRSSCRCLMIHTLLRVESILSAAERTRVGKTYDLLKVPMIGQVGLCLLSLPKPSWFRRSLWKGTLWAVFSFESRVVKNLHSLSRSRAPGNTKFDCLIPCLSSSLAAYPN